MDAKSHQGNAACLRMIAESEAILGGGGGRSIMQKSQGAAPACLYRLEHTRFHPLAHTHTRTHTQHAGPEEAVAAVV